MTTLGILGGGCAGLSLGSALAARGVAATILERRPAYARDRTWCFWNVQPHRFDAAITHRWSRWAVRYRGQTVVRSAPGLEYVHVDGGRFYEHAQEALRGSSVELRLGVDVSPAATVDFERIYDTRPRELPRPVPSGDIRVLQHFRGAFVRTEAPVFDPETAMLMDFDVPQERGLAFVYLLPFSNREALVEATWFSESVHDASIYEETLARWRKERLGIDRWTVLETERGVLPMTTERLGSESGARVQRLGVAGGSAKPSTGYAFLAIQRQVEALAAGIERGEYDVPPARGPSELAMDRVMLDWMVRHPGDAPALFLRLFDRVGARTLARFLSEQATAREQLEVMRVVPMASFTASTVRGAWGALRRTARDARNAR